MVFARDGQIYRAPITGTRATNAVDRGEEPFIRAVAVLAPLGAVGCGLSTAMVSWLGLGCALAYLLRNPAYRRYRIFSHWQAPQPRALAALLRLGVPMGFSTFIEITSFTLIALFVARLGADAVAGHRVVANLAALVYMLPLAMSIANTGCWPVSCAPV